MAGVTWFAELTGAAEGETYDEFVGGIALGRAETVSMSARAKSRVHR